MDLSQGKSNHLEYLAIYFCKDYGPLVKRSKTSPFHGGYTGSNPVRVTNFLQMVVDAAANSHGPVV
jgi:hypothetical protein